MKKAFVWDLPTRLFHWALVILVGISFYTGSTGGFVEMDYHMYAGYAILSLVLFRILWGFIGSDHSRFIHFIRSPGVILAYTRSLRIPSEPRVGHNPLGALSIIAMLSVLLLQVGTGLFANDDILLEGPLSHLVSYDTSRQLTAIHKTNRWIIVGLIALHLLAVTYYQVIRKHNIIQPMITGWMKVSQDIPAQRNNRLLAIVTLGLTSGFVYYLVNFV
ncbi:MAG: cytochrome b/b6 domain-containing protein [Pseudomonadales bacterium]